MWIISEHMNIPIGCAKKCWCNLDVGRANQIFPTAYSTPVKDTSLFEIESCTDLGNIDVTSWNPYFCAIPNPHFFRF